MLNTMSGVLELMTVMKNISFYLDWLHP